MFWRFLCLWLVVAAVLAALVHGSASERPAETITEPFQPPRLQPSVELIATAYTAGPESTGKKPGDKGYGVTSSGLPAAYGVAAVDPAVIPLGTVLYVPGYGYAVAADTGGAIKGKKVDLFFPTVEEALRWGVREVRAIVVGKGVLDASRPGFLSSTDKQPERSTDNA